VPYGPDLKDTEDEVCAALVAGKWLELSGDNPAGDVIRRCWAFSYDTASQGFEGLSNLLHA
jgi:hypothetical protein